MEAEFQRALIIVAIVGTVIFAAGAAVLFVVFRGVGNAGAGKQKHMTLMLSLVAFIFLCCLGLFIYSFVFEPR